MHVLLHALIIFYCLLAPAHCLKIAAITSLPPTNHGDVQLVVGGVLECARACCSRSWCAVVGFRRRYVTCHLFPSTDGLVGQEGAVKDTVFFLREDLECSVSCKNINSCSENRSENRQLKNIENKDSVHTYMFKY